MNIDQLRADAAGYHHMKEESTALRRLLWVILNQCGSVRIPISAIEAITDAEARRLHVKTTVHPPTHEYIIEAIRS